MQNSISQTYAWYSILIILVGLGVLFRVINLDQPVYWVDEVATSMRVSGYTNQEVTKQLATGSPLQVSDFLKFQELRTDASWNNFLSVLIQSPEHAPLYFILLRFWCEAWGNSVIATRSLSVVFSLLSIPAMYLFARDLFKSPRIGWTAMTILAISPFFIAYAQEARPYSLWVLLLLLFCWFLWQALQYNQLRFWYGYILCLILSLYTSLLTVMIVLGQSLLVFLLYPKQRQPYFVSTAFAFFLFLPWIIVIFTHWQILQSNTEWTQVPMSIWNILWVWFYSLAVLFFDFPIAAGNPILMGLQLFCATATVSLISYSIYSLVAKTSRQTYGFLLMSGFSIPFFLLSIDLMRNGQAAATPRYLMPAQLTVLIAVASCLRDRLLWSRWRLITALLLSVTVMSGLIGLNHTSKYQKSRNLSNPAITEILNQEQSPRLMAEADQLQDLISLSYQLEPDITVYLLPSSASEEKWLANFPESNQPTFIFNPSPSLKRAFKDTSWRKLQLVYQPTGLISGELKLSLWKSSKET